MIRLREAVPYTLKHKEKGISWVMQGDRKRRGDFNDTSLIRDSTAFAARALAAAAAVGLCAARVAALVGEDELVGGAVAAGDAGLDVGEYHRCGRDGSFRASAGMGTAGGGGDVFCDGAVDGSKRDVEAVNCVLLQGALSIRETASD